MLTDSRFIIGVLVGAGLVYFAVPFVRGVMTQKQQAPGR